MLLACLLAAGGSEQERTVRAPAVKPSQEACRPPMVVGAQLSRRERKLVKDLRGAMRNDDATVLCASDVDYMSGDHVRRP
jgi:hypothetical protein